MMVRNDRIKEELRGLEAQWLYHLRGLRDGAIEGRQSPRADVLIYSSGDRRLIERKRGRVTYDHEIDPNATELVPRHVRKFEQDDENVQEIGIPGEPHIWEALKRAKNAAEVRRAFSRSRHWLIREWKQTFPNGGFIYFPSLTATLYDHAEEFCEAKLSERYPRADTQHSDDRRIEYLARVLAGLSLRKRMRPSYADKTLRALAPRNPR